MSTSSLVTMSPAIARNGIGNASKSLVCVSACDGLEIERDLLSADYALGNSELFDPTPIWDRKAQDRRPFATECGRRGSCCRKDVDQLMASIIASCWSYAGSEHAADDRAAAHLQCSRRDHFFQHTNHADVRDSAGTAAAERESDFRPRQHRLLAGILCVQRRWTKQCQQQRRRDEKLVQACAFVNWNAREPNRLPKDCAETIVTWPKATISFTMHGHEDASRNS